MAKNSWPITRAVLSTLSLQCMTHLKVTCEIQLHINFHEITCVRDSCKSHAHDTLRSRNTKVSD